MVTWWSPSLPNMSGTGQKLAKLACRQTLIQSHFPVLSSTDMNCQLNSGGLGAHGSNPCTPTNKKARNRGLFSFLGMVSQDVQNRPWSPRGLQPCLHSAELRPAFDWTHRRFQTRPSKKESSWVESNRPTMKTCPYCAEDIKEKAIKCKHCGEFLDRDRKPEVARKPDAAKLSAQSDPYYWSRVAGAFVALLILFISMPDPHPYGDKIRLSDALFLHPVLGPALKGLGVIAGSWLVAEIQKEAGTGCFVVFYGGIAASVWLFLSH